MGSLNRVSVTKTDYFVCEAHLGNSPLGLLRPGSGRWDTSQGQDAGRRTSHSPRRGHLSRRKCSRYARRSGACRPLYSVRTAKHAAHPLLFGKGTCAVEVDARNADAKSRAFLAQRGEGTGTPPARTPRLRAGNVRRLRKPKRPRLNQIEAIPAPCDKVALSARAVFIAVFARKSVFRHLSPQMPPLTPSLKLDLHEISFAKPYSIMYWRRPASLLANVSVNALMTTSFSCGVLAFGQSSRNFFMAGSRLFSICTSWSGLCARSA